MTTTEYAKLVRSLGQSQILGKWPEVTPLHRISGIATADSGALASDAKLFEGHDEEQIKLMEELCIVLDFNDQPVGAGTKKLCHVMKNINGGLLHRAFSVFLFNEDGRLLLQQRALEKITFPDMWTNTCCSHPLCVASELGLDSPQRNDIDDLSTAVNGAKIAARRKLFHELGIPESDCPLTNFDFLTRIHYKAASGGEASQWGEHEIDYILILKAKNDITIQPNLNEVRDYKFVSAEELKEMFKDKLLVFTPWFKLICETFLFNWWAKLDEVQQFEDQAIHRLL